MTIAVDLGRKANKQTKNKNELLNVGGNKATDLEG